MNHDHEQCNEMIKEWKQWKAYALLALVGALAAFLSYGVWLGNTGTRIDQLEEETEKQAVQVSSIYTAQSSIQSELAGIRVELKNILLRLEELRR